MALFKKKPEVWEARVFTGEVKNITDVTGWLQTCGVTDILVTSAKDNKETIKTITFNCPANGKLSADSGEWILKGTNGMEVLSAVTLYVNYEQM